MIEFLTTQGLNFYLENLLKNANSTIILISPYIQLQKRIKDLLLEKKQNGIEIVIACRKNSLKEEISEYTTKIYDVPTLHAKCYMNENEAILTSLNLYEFSQQNNEEMGIYVKNVGSGASIYQQVVTEAKRLCNTEVKQPKTSPLPIEPAPFRIGQQYTADQLQSFFNFDYQGRAGIKESAIHDIVLFSNSNSPYPLIVQDGIVYYQGQNTGGGHQQLIHGNRLLYDSYNNPNTKIYLFRDFVFQGMYSIVMPPYQEKGRWIFPLTSC